MLVTQNQNMRQGPAANNWKHEVVEMDLKLVSNHAVFPDLRWFFEQVWILVGNR